MIFSIVIIIIVVIIICLHWTTLRNNQEPATTWLFFIILLLGTAIAIALSFHLRIPSPVQLVTFIYQPLSNVIEAFLHI
ncbi:hypothetical protein [Metasolibacillus sp.]|uniref:hypothetical protein n=1 Tax=Metasolibacillus sp. TaxID=2703680 RepID=UPI0025F81A01|nr:hypothetical protein [Metasolibacillus sp.]MCT6925036.1 hypothetical protein [Metasolibacillus sp.]MCT6941271.1 hypothetical protein [Metasolibacillus sp.]